MKSEDVLRYTEQTISRATVRRHYVRWRNAQVPPIPERCDNGDCRYHTELLEWNGKPVTLILDHTNGVNSDNRVHNLRLLCPNCNSQLRTHGGGNKGRVEKSTGGFAIKRPDGLRDYVLPAESGTYKLN